MKTSILSILSLSIALFSCKNRSSADQGEMDKNQAYSLQSGPHDQAQSSSLSILNWNVEWFGSTTNGPVDKDLQQKNVAKVLKESNANVYALCEIVDTARFGRMVRSLNPNLQYVISSFCSDATTPQDPDWIKGQKMVFLYNPAEVQVVNARPFVTNNPSAAHNFSNGRLPFLIQTKIHDKNVNFIILHAKAGADFYSWQRRHDASQVLLDSMQAEFAHVPTILLGDFNDEMAGSITHGHQSPYDNLLSGGFTDLTAQVAKDGRTTTIDYKNVIDHQLVNKEMLAFYNQSSTQVLSFVDELIANYSKGNTSDHYPVISFFNFKGEAAVAPADNSSAHQNITTHPIQLVSNDFVNDVDLKILESLSNVTFGIYNSQGKKLLSFKKNQLDKGTTFHLHAKDLAAGTYTLLIQTDVFSLSYMIRKQ